MNFSLMKSSLMNAIVHSCPDIGKDDIEALVACARSNHISAGDKVCALERRLCEDLGYKGAVATVNGSQSIHLSLRALFPQKNALVGLPSYICRTVYDAICLSGCRPVVLDIDPYTFSVSIEQTTRHSLDAIIVPHMFGIRAPIEKFVKAGLTVIEDCAQRFALQNVMIREPKTAVRILSFSAPKLLAGGEGGMLLSNDLALCERARNLRDAPYDFPEPAVCLPYTDLQAALVEAQWARLSSFLERRRRLAMFYLESLGRAYPERIVPAMMAADTYHFRFLLSVDDPVIFIKSGAKKGIAFRRPVAPMGLHTLFRIDGDFPITEKALAHVVSIPLYPRLTEDEAQKVVEVVMEVVG